MDLHRREARGPQQAGQLRPDARVRAARRRGVLVPDEIAVEGRARRPADVGGEVHVLHHKAPARPKGVAEDRQGAGRVGQVRQQEPRIDDVEGPEAPRQAEIALVEFRVGERRGFGDAEGLVVEIDADHRAPRSDPARQFSGDAAGPTADVQRAGAFRYGHTVEQLGGGLRHGLGQYGQARGALGAAVDDVALRHEAPCLPAPARTEPHQHTSIGPIFATEAIFKWTGAPVSRSP